MACKWLHERGSDARVNIYDISRRAGVSIATVSRVLNDNPHVSAETRERVLAVMNACGYVPNAFARGLGLNTMKTIGLLCPDASDPYQARALSELERAFRAKGYDCLLSCTGKALSDRAAGVEQLRGRHVDGLVLMGSSFIENEEEGNAYIRQAAEHMPVLLLNGAYSCPNVYCVLCDDRRATREATAYLTTNGRRRILYLHHSRNYSGLRKLEGYRDGLMAAGLPVDERLIALFEGDKADAHSVRDALLALDAGGLAFDAVLTSEDTLAVGAIKYARAAGRRVPEDLMVIGYNNSAVCRYCEPELTSVDNRLHAVCERLAVTMTGVLSGEEMPQRTVFAGELVCRASA